MLYDNQLQVSSPKLGKIVAGMFQNLENSDFDNCFPKVDKVRVSSELEIMLSTFNLFLEKPPKIIIFTDFASEKSENIRLLVGSGNQNLPLFFRN